MDFLSIARECSNTHATLSEDFLIRFGNAIIQKVKSEFEEPYETYDNKWIVELLDGMVHYDY